jgi:hypothetical protein
VNPVLKKLQLKAHHRALVVGAPEGYQSTLKDMAKMGVEVATSLTGAFDFVHVFATRRADLEPKITRIKKALKPNGILWVSYPKAKALDTDLNRDILHAALEKLGLDGVSLVSIDETWSALRFKRLE